MLQKSLPSSDDSPAAAKTMKIAARASGASGGEHSQRVARELRLGDEAARAAVLEVRRVVRGVAARGQHDGGAAAGAAASAARDLDPVDVGQADVEQDDLGAQPPDGLEPLVAGRALADHVEAVGFEQGSRGVAEPGVIIDYENGLRHRDRLPTTAKSKSAVAPLAGQASRTPVEWSP